MANDGEAMEAGETFGRFRLVRKLGSGSHGTVWEAEDPLLSERLALKVLHPWRMHEPDARERLKREVILARRIVHPGVCRIYDLHEAAGTLFITMQFVDGRPLSAVVKDEALSAVRAVAILRRLAGAVVAAHAAGVVHRDLKPANVSVGKDDDVVVLDFGIASSHDLGRLTRPGLAVGTLRFLAPEVWRSGSATEKSDQFALGVIGYIMFTRRMPFPHKDAATEMLAALQEPPTPIRDLSPDVPRGVAAVVERAFAFDPERRFPDVAAFERALADSLDQSMADRTSPELSLPAAELAAQDYERADRTLITRPLDLSLPDASSADIRLVEGAPSRTTPASTSTATVAVLPELPRLPVVPLVAGLAVAVVVVGVAIALAGGEPVARIADAGVVVVVAPEPVIDPVPAKAPVPPEPVVVDPLEAVAAQVRALQVDGRNLGLRPGDVPAWDEALARAVNARRGPVQAAEWYIKKARVVVDGVVVDQAFAKAKLERFNRAADNAVLRTPALREKLRPFAKDIADKMAKGDARGANRAINVAWGVVDRQKH